MFFRKGFWLVFASVSAFHIVEDIAWAVIARFTDTPIYLIVLGILIWSLIASIFVYSKPVRKYWRRKVP